jgi:hypothetical protein
MVIRSWVGVGIAALLLGGALAAIANAHVIAPPPARAARTLQATDTAHLHYIHSSGSLLLEEGSATGTLPGRMRASVRVGPNTTGTFTIFSRYGTIRGRGSAKLRGSGTYESFAGTLVAEGGTGRYAHAHGRAGLYGLFNRRTYALTVQTTGRLLF